MAWLTLIILDSGVTRVEDRILPLPLHPRLLVSWPR